MSHDHVDIVLEMELGYPAGKMVLVHLARHACRTCGLAWPGIPLLERKTGMGATTVRKALDWLLNDKDRLKIHAYPKGGRGVSTEYIVLPGFMELSTAPCEECRARMKTHRNPRGIEHDVQAKPTGIRGVLAKPTTFGGQNPSESGDQSVIESNQSPALRAAPPVETAPPHPTSDPPLTPAQEALARVEAMTKGIGHPDP